MFADDTAVASGKMARDIGMALFTLGFAALLYREHLGPRVLEARRDEPPPQEADIDGHLVRQPREAELGRFFRHAADLVANALTAKIVELPEQLRRSLTWDQGAEMAQHAQLRIETGLAIYFCDPRSPWQRGSNENTNGLLRQYFPKGTDVSRYSERELDAVAATLNGRPRKTLGWKTPAEALDELLFSAQQTGVATTP